MRSTSTCAHAATPASTVCPENAIDFSYQVDLSRCKSHRDCVRVCEAAGAIDFQREAQDVSEHFDLVLDLGAMPALALHQPPQGYFHAADDTALIAAVLQLRESVGEFEKPKFFNYRQKICAHSRNEVIGCRACIDVCSAQAIRSDASQKGKANKGARGGPAGMAGATGAGIGVAASGAGIIVEPHLCVGCGACTTVCPSGALSYATPSAPDMGQRLRTLLATYQRAGGRDAALLLHSQAAGAALIGDLGRAARTETAVRGVPARVLPVDTWHTASVGIDLWLAAIAYGASQVWVLMTAEEAPQYRAAVAEQMAVAQAVLSGLGFQGEHFRIVSATDVRLLDAALQAAPAAGVNRAASVCGAGRQTRHARPGDRAPGVVFSCGAGGDCLARAGQPIAQPVRQPESRHRQVHDVPELRERLPRSGAGRQPGSARSSSSSRRTACNAACVPAPAPRAPSRSIRACGCLTPARRGATRVCCTRSSPTRASNAANCSAPCPGSRT